MDPLILKPQSELEWHTLFSNLNDVDEKSESENCIILCENNQKKIFEVADSEFWVKFAILNKDGGCNMAYRVPTRWTRFYKNHQIVSRR